MPATREHALEMSDSNALARLAISGRVRIAEARAAARDRKPIVSGRTTAARRRRQAAIARLLWPAAGVLVMLGPVFAFLAFGAASSWQSERSRAQFQEALTERAHRISQQVHGFTEVLHACQSLYDASELVTREEFATFTRKARARHPSIRTIAWVPRVLSGDLDAFERHVRASDRPDYRVVPRGSQPWHYPVLYVEPLRGNEPLVGVDLRGRARVRRAIERAIETGGVALSDPIEPVGGGQEVPEAVLALGVYEKVPDGGERQPLGTVILRFAHADLATHAEEVADGAAMALSIIDTSADGKPVVAAAASGTAGDADISAKARVRIAGQTWMLVGVPAQAFSHGGVVSPLVIALAVFLVWELFAGFLIALGHASRGHALRRQGRVVHHVLQSLGEGVVVAGRDGRVLLANAAALELIGSDTRGLSADALALRLQFVDAEGGVARSVGARPMDRAISGRSIDEEECLLRTPAVPEGLWVSVSAHPLRNETGDVRGGVMVLRDVSARRASEDRLRERQMEMELAASVQRSLYPCAPPRVAGLDVAGAVYPADETCGDYFDYIPLPDGAICLAIGDVSGHGLGPALVMAETRAYVRSLAATGTAPKTILTRSNAMLAHDLVDGLFVTMLLIDLNPYTRSLSYASAGHTPGLLLDAQGELKAELTRTGRPLGMFDDSTYEARNGLKLEDGDLLVLMTDGATEAASPDGDLFEEAGVLEVVRRHRAEPAAVILDRVYEAILEFSAGLSSRDDVTLLVCKGGA